MADIELVIKVDERDIDFARKTYKPEGYSSVPSCIQTGFISAILNGTPLPKGHGDLIAKGQAVALVEFYKLNPQHFGFDNLIVDIDNEEPIIPAESEE